MGKPGRPTKYSKNLINTARVAYQEGFTDQKFCKLIDVSRETLWQWRRQYSDFSNAIQEGKDFFDSEKVEVSLKRRALGFRFTETTREPNENGQMQVVKKVSKLVVADTAAICFWLKNRRRDRWKDIKAIEASGPEGGPIPIQYVDAK